MDMILLDWTRMGKAYCLAGVVREGGNWRVVRPLWSRFRNAETPNVGWSPFLLDTHARWELFELVGIKPSAPAPPHVEDLWVAALKPRRQSATPAQRHTILDATQPADGAPPFGAPLEATRTAAYLQPGQGSCSLVTVRVAVAGLTFSVNQWRRTDTLDARVSFDLPGLPHRSLPIKDHHLLRRAEGVGADPAAQAQALSEAVRQMGPIVAVRLGLSRPFAATEGPAARPLCWLMADGFFSWDAPQP